MFPQAYWPDPRFSFPTMPPFSPYCGGYSSGYPPPTHGFTGVGAAIPTGVPARDARSVRHSLGSMYSQGLLSSTDQSPTGGMVDSSVAEILRELKLAKVNVVALL